MMEEENTIQLRATIDRKATLTVYDDQDRVLSQKKIERSQQRSTFTFQGEEITWVCEIIKPKSTGKRGYMLLYLYPVNLNYNANPIRVEEV